MLPVIFDVTFNIQHLAETAGRAKVSGHLGLLIESLSQKTTVTATNELGQFLKHQLIQIGICPTALVGRNNGIECYLYHGFKQIPPKANGLK